MENLLFIKAEIFILLTSFLYILYYLWIKFYNIYFKVKEVIIPKNIETKKTALNRVKIKKQDSWVSNSSSYKKVTAAEKKELSEILKRVKMNSSKWYFDVAKNLIVQGLSLDKYNKDLNIELASIYEKEKNYLNAEYIYKDLLEVLKVDFEVMKKLWFIYALQNKFKESLDIYEQIHKKKMGDDLVIDYMAEISFSMKNYKKALKYSNLFLTWKPRSVDKLFIKAKCLIEIWKKTDSMPVYKRILELQPYNTKAKDCLFEIENELNPS